MAAAVAAAHEEGRRKVQVVQHMYEARLAEAREREIALSSLSGVKGPPSTLQPVTMPFGGEGGEGGGGVGLGLDAAALEGRVRRLQIENDSLTAEVSQIKASKQSKLAMHTHTT